MMVDTVRGRPRVRAWPKKRGRPKSQKQLDAILQFSAYQWVAKNADPRMLYAAGEATRGTPFYPRDLLTMAMSGRLFTIDFPGERSLYSMAQRRDVSESLDILASTPGYTLVRGPQFWQGVPAPSSALSWFWNIPAGTLPTGTNTGARPTKGARYTAADDIVISGLAARFNAVDTAIYRMHVAILDGSDVITELFSTAPWQSDSDGFINKFWAAGATVVKGDTFAILLSRVDGISNYVLPLVTLTTTRFLLPMGNSNYLSLANGVVSVGDTLSTSIGGTTGPAFAIRGGPAV
jgi:hypothetical protein